LTGDDRHELQKRDPESQPDGNEEARPTPSRIFVKDFGKEGQASRKGCMHLKHSSKIPYRYRVAVRWSAAAVATILFFDLERVTK
jgi:hypothetical protein